MGMLIWPEGIMDGMDIGICAAGFISDILVR